MELQERREEGAPRSAGSRPTSSHSHEVQNGFGDGLAKAFELVLTPAIFGLGGFGLDRWLGLTPLFTVLLTVWALGAVSYMTWFRYDAEMRQLEEGAVWARTRRERP